MSSSILSMNTFICDDVFMDLLNILKYKYRFMYGSLYYINYTTCTVQVIQAICGTSTTTIQLCTRGIYDFASMTNNSISTSTGTTDDNMMYHT